MDTLICVPLNDDMGRRAGDHLRRFHRSHGLALGDALIAAAAAVHGCAWWTRNRKRYPMKDIELVP
jgi:predicted nucleic acid-binding protein